MSTWPRHTRKNPCLPSRLGSQGPTERPESANLLDPVPPAVGELQSRIPRKRHFQLAPSGFAGSARARAPSPGRHRAGQRGSPGFLQPRCTKLPEGKRRAFGVGLDHRPHPLPQDRPHQNIGVHHQSSTWHSASSRGQSGGFPCIPPSARPHWRPRRRSSRPSPLLPHA